MRSSAVEQARNETRKSDPAKRPTECQVCSTRIRVVPGGRWRKFCGLGRCRTESKQEAEARRSRENAKAYGPLTRAGQLLCECSALREPGKHACARCLRLESEQYRTATKRAAHDWQGEDE